jgi:hypothetical protein
MRRVIAAIDKKNKKANGRRGLLQSEDELCVIYEGSGECDEMTVSSSSSTGSCTSSTSNCSPGYAPVRSCDCVLTSSI